MRIVINELEQGKWSMESDDELVNGIINKLNPGGEITGLGIVAVVKILFDNTFVAGAYSEEFRQYVEKMIHEVK